VKTTVTRRGALLLALGGASSPVLALAQEEHGSKNPVDKGARALGVDMREKLPHTPEQEALAKSIGLDVVCLCGTCPKRTITECDCGWALQNQTALVNAVVKGYSRGDIVSAYRRVYGDQVLAMLPNEGFKVAAWVVPYAMGAIGLASALLVGVWYRRRSHAMAAQPTAPEGAPGVPLDEAAAKAELQKELEDMD
jgi:cytochrome c-type biogenesis protein CcmH/NrfF